MNEEEAKGTLKTMKENIEAIESALNLLEKKDKMIDEMAEIICNVYKGTLEYNRELALATTKEVKQYFERKVENG